MVLDRWPAVLGVVNVTPDSFSDGGRYLDPDAAVAHGTALAAAGATVLDVGGESTRPGAQPVDPAEEIRRVVPVVRRLVAEAGVPVGVDTRHAVVAEAAVGAGAVLVNDVSGGLHDPAMLRFVADAGVGYLVMHSRGTPATMAGLADYADVVAEVTAELRDRLDAARTAGIEPGRLLADPGLGFAKAAAHSVELLARLPELVAALGVPVVVGPSRKSFLARLGVGPGEAELGVDERDDVTLAAVVWALDQGAHGVRVHDVRSARRAAQVLDVMQRAYDGGLVARSGGVGEAA